MSHVGTGRPTLSDERGGEQSRNKSYAQKMAHSSSVAFELDRERRAFTRPLVNTRG
jgi:hypothetical protein